MSKRRVSYFYDNEVGSFYYGQEHPMKPFRMKMTHQLIVNYGLYRRMNCYVSDLTFTITVAATQSHRPGNVSLPLSRVHSTP